MFSEMKLPNWKRTYLFFKRMREHDGSGPIAAQCGKETQTVDAWCRPVATDEHPQGTGKANPLDCMIRLIGYAFTWEPGLAREMAETATDYVDYLEGKPSVRMVSPNTLIASSVKEHGEAIIAVLNIDKPNFVKAYTEIVQAEIEIRKLKAWAKEEMKHETEVSMNGGGR